MVAMPLHTIIRIATVVQIAAAAVALAAADPRLGDVHAQAAAGRTTDPSVAGSRFLLAPAAAADLRLLWVASSAAKQEHVACLGGERRDGVTHITEVLILEPGAADSLGTSAGRSIETCGPPQWFGTVHTHIALHDGEHPYSTFSGADRGVMLLWWRRWHVDGTFCVLYTPSSAHCEVDGITVRQIGGRESEISY
jgi:hypothetical protein